MARQTWRTVEPVHALAYFAPEVIKAQEDSGLMGRTGYFAFRAAAMGAVSAGVVTATFFNFSPDLVAEAIPSAWDRLTPTEAVRVRLSAVDQALRRLLGESVIGSGEMEEAAALARRAAESVCERAEGRPLFAGHAALRWPDPPHLVLWHAQTLLREFRGDAHVALLTAAGLTGVEALVVHGATGEVAPAILRSTRAWSAEAWADAEDSLRGRGWLDASGALTEAGAAHRQSVEDGTDALARPAYEALGEDGCGRLRQLVRPWSRVIAESPEFGFARPG